MCLLGGGACLGGSAEDDAEEIDADADKSGGNIFTEVELDECPYPRNDWEYYNEPSLYPSDNLSWVYTDDNYGEQQLITQRRIEHAFAVTNHSFDDRQVHGTWYIDSEGNKKYFILHLAPPNDAVNESVVFIPNHSYPVAVLMDNEGDVYGNTELVRCWIP